MTKEKKRLLFITHDASLSGAPVLLLNLLQLLKDEPSIEYTIVIKRGGYLGKRFADAGNTILLKPAKGAAGKNPLIKLVWLIKNRWRIHQTIKEASRADCIINNTSSNGRLLKRLAKTRTPVISYIHELENMTVHLNRHKDVDLTMQHTNLFLFPSHAVSRFLHSKYGIAFSKQQRLPYYFPIESAYTHEQKAAARKTFASRYNLNSDTLWVVGMGTISLRKGVDYFLDTCRLAHSQGLPISFIWIGGYENAEGEQFFAEKIRLLNNANLVFTGNIDNNPANLLPFDVFFTSSREDPYPLVVLEAAYVKVPGICFENAGGIAEFVEDDAGWIIPGFSPQNVVQLLQALCHNPGLITTKGETAFHKAVEWHSNKSLIRQAFWDAVETVAPTATGKTKNP